jgi:lipoprotein-releasing system permease protein
MRPGPSLFFARRILGLRSGEGRREGRGAQEGQGRRYLRGAVLGVALSIVPLVLVLIVADGMIQGITSRYIEVGTYHLQAEPFGVIDQTALDEAAASLRERLGARTFPEVQGFGVAISGSRTAGVAIRAVDPAFLADRGTADYLKASSGEARLSSGNQILLGEALAKELGAKPGDTVSIVTSRPQGGIGQAGFVPKVSVFRVSGIVSAGYRELDALWAFVSLKSAARIFAPGASRSLVGIKVERPFADLEAQRTLAQKNLSPAWRVQTWPEAERNVYKSFATTRALLLLVMALAVAVAAINVGSALVMLVLERRRDIAILKSAGASPGFIRRIFVITGLAIGGLGTLIGIAAGSLLAWRINDLISLLEAAVNAAARLGAALAGNRPPEALRLLDPAYYLEKIPVQIRPEELALVAAASLGLCLFASLFPAGRAARLPPLDIFRKT